MIIKNKFFFKNVLAIEDAELDSYVIRKVMTMSNFAKVVTFYRSAKDALEYFRQNPKKKDVQLILLDIYMPDMDGFELIKQLGNMDATKDLPVILLTASLDESDRRKARSYPNVRLFLNKPLNIEKIEQIKACFT